MPTVLGRQKTSRYGQIIKIPLCDFKKKFVSYKNQQKRADESTQYNIFNVI